MKSESNLEKILEKGLFAVTGELGPPKGNDINVIKRKVELLRGYVMQSMLRITRLRSSGCRASPLLSFLFRWGWNR